MSRSIDRHRLKRAIRDIQIMGGDDKSEQAKTYSNLIATLASAGGEIASTQLKKKEDAEKNKERDAAVADAQTKRKAAVLAAADALRESDSNGPLHKAAAAAEAEALVAEAKAAFYTQGQGTPGAGWQPSGGPPWYESTGFKIAVGVTGAGILGLIIYKIATSGRRSAVGG